MAQIFKAKTLVSNTGRFSNEATAPNLVYNTGDQNISGAKNFYTRPTVNGTGVLLSGDVLNLPDTIVYTTGNQNIGGLKDFTTRPTVNTIPVLLSGEVNTTISGVLYSAQINIKNDNGSTIYRGQPVYVSSAAGSNILVKLASNSGEQTSSKTLGLVYQTSLAQNAQGTIVTEGLLQGFNTNAGEEGDPIWLGPTGSLIFGLANKPYAPNHLVYLGVVTRKQANQGEVFVKIQNGFELEELHNVNINHTNALADKNIIRYNSLSGIWFNDTINSVLPNTLVYTTGDQNISGVKNFYSRPTVNGSGVFLIGESGSFPPSQNNVVYTTGNQTIDGLKNFSTIPTVNGTGVLLAGSPIPPTEASGAGGSIFITYVSPSGGIGNVGDYVYETPGQTIGNTALISCSTTTQNVLVDIYALQGRTRFKPKLYIAGQEIPSSLVLRQDDRPVFLVNDFGVNLNNATSLRVDHEDGAFYGISITQDAPPQVTSAYFFGGYPTSPAQTELKLNDTFNFTVNSDVAIVAIQIYDFGAAQSNTHNFTAVTSKNITIAIADRGNTTQNLGVKLRVQKANGSWSSDYLTSDYGSTDGTHTVKLNNTRPSISIGSITYPVGQQALKDSESATVSNTVTSFDVISYTSPNGDLTITSSSTYQTSKTVTRAAGNYNINNNNFIITATRNANNAVATNSSTVVKIAHTAPTLTVSVPAARLRTGGNDGTSAQSYTVTITATQQLLSAPTLSVPAGGGTLGSFGGSTTTWTATLSNINDNLTKGTYTWGAISATNLAGKVVTTITTGPTYVIGGFLSRTVSLAAFANEVNINTSVLDYSKMTLSWVIKSLPNKRAVGTTATPDPDSWSINSLSVNPTIVRILDTAATQSSSQATNVTVEETV